LKTGQFRPAPIGVIGYFARMTGEALPYSSLRRGVSFACDRNGVNRLLERFPITSTWPSVMAGLVPAIHALRRGKDVDARDKPGHDGESLIVNHIGNRSNEALPLAPPG
jgi:hypothetical protein